MKILAIDTSCDDTCAAVLENDKILSNVISSQTDLHAQWGGVVPDIAKRAHAERIDAVIATALKPLSAFAVSPLDKGENKKEKRDSSTSVGMTIKNKSINKIESMIGNGMKEIDVIAVTIGPGLAIALGIGVNRAKELALKYNKKLVAVNHIEGHILSNLAKNSQNKPERKIEYPALVLTVSGGHTKLILMKNPSKSPSSKEDRGFDKGDFNPKYTVIGETLDDAAGEALDKASKMLGLGYPGGPIIERLASKGDIDWMKLPRPLSTQKTFDYSFSGLKTSFYYQVKDWPKEKISTNLSDLAASFQEAVFDSLLIKYKLAIKEFKPKTLLASGGVVANKDLRKKLRKLAKEFSLPIYMPFKKELNTDNAAMIGVAGYYKALREEFVEDIEGLDRKPRAEI